MCVYRVITREACEDRDNGRAEVPIVCDAEKDYLEEVYTTEGNSIAGNEAFALLFWVAELILLVGDGAAKFDVVGDGPHAEGEFIWVEMDVFCCNKAFEGCEAAGSALLGRGDRACQGEDRRDPAGAGDSNKHIVPGDDVSEAEGDDVADVGHDALGYLREEPKALDCVAGDLRLVAEGDGQEEDVRRHALHVVCAASPRACVCEGPRAVIKDAGPHRPQPVRV